VTGEPINGMSYGIGLESYSMMYHHVIFVCDMTIAKIAQ